ncbi:MAG: acyltransferase [Stenomitos rutilans HA7619-LM2]|jgi:acetyltransferase-like isoleucine patch superfamily enzyme|nr:acyltransferase [Stenomitos rutilans HA7619-LM2]
MKPRLILTWIVSYYQKARLGFVGDASNISLLADIRGDKKNIFLGNYTTVCKYATLEADISKTDQSKIFIGDNTLISSFAILRTYGGIIKIGDSCFVNSFSVLYGHGDLIIGNGVLIGPQVTLIPANYGFKDRDTPFRQQVASMKGITIEDNVWIGAGVTILDGCTVGKGAVIGAGAVVTKTVEPYAIVAGIPARKIGSRE